MSKIESPKFSFSGWNIKEFIKGRKKLLVAGIGYIAGYLITHHPVYSGIVSAGAELLYAVIEYYAKAR